MGTSLYRRDHNFPEAFQNRRMIRFVRCKEVTSFWDMEVNHILKGKQIPLWTNPTVGARLGEKVRFHVLGTAFHTFHLQGHRWLESGATSVDTANLGTDQPPASSLRPVRAWGPVNGTTDL